MNLSKGSCFDPSNCDGGIVSRTFQIHNFDPYPQRKILILRGQVTVTITSTVCNEIVVEETREFKKVIRLDNISTENICKQTVLEEIFEACPFLEENVLNHLSRVIEQFNDPKYNERGYGIPFQARGGMDLEDFFEVGDNTLNSVNNETDLRDVEIINLETYIELLYDELTDKANGARYISRLTKTPENLVTIANHETALNALFRTLREDCKKSMDLTTNILKVCLNYAQFKDFHSLLVTNKICSITFDIIEFELARYEKWRLEIYRRKELAERYDVPAKVRNDFDKIRLKFGELTRQQDNLLTVAFGVILHLSENNLLHQEIHARGIVKLLAKSLDRKNLDLLSVVVSFLGRISIYKDCSNQAEIVEKIVDLANANIPNELVHLCLRLIFNLSFDTKSRHKMIKLGLLPTISQYFDNPDFEAMSLNILYNMSMDRRVRPKFSVTSAIATVIRLITKQQKTGITVELAALGINLACNKRCGVVLCENNGLVSLLQQAFENEDELIMKMVRNLSEQEITKHLFQDYTSDLASAIGKATSKEFSLEVVGTLSNLNLPYLDFCKLILQFQLIPWMQSILMKYINSTSPLDDMEDNRILMEVIILIGTCCGDADCAELFTKKSIIEILLTLFFKLEKDTELRTQTLFVFYKLSFHPKTRWYIVEKTKIPQTMLDLLPDPSGNISDLCEATLNMIGEYDDSWRDKIKSQRFTIHNQSWIEMTERMRNDPEIETVPDEISDPDIEDAGEIMVLELPSSAYETMASESETDDSGKGDEEYNKSASTESEVKSIFERFEHQYEQEMEAKERWEYGISDDDDVTSP